MSQERSSVRVGWIHAHVLTMAVGLLGSLPGCSCADTTPRVSPCMTGSPPAGCDTACSLTSPCPTGLYCAGSGRCTADCSAAIPCANGATCAADGRCIGGTDASAPRDTALVIPDAPPIDHTCASVTLGTTRVTPNVIVIVDQSGSMSTNEFPAGSGVTRWDALENALLAMPSGLLFSLQSSVRFGMAWFHEDRAAMSCPSVTTVPCALDNYAAISAQYMMQTPSGGTPTGQSIDQLVAMRSSLISDPTQPTIFVLATDGEPNACGSRDTTMGRAMSLAAVQNAFTMGVHTYVVSVGTDTATTHLQDLANAGIGSSGTPAAPFWVASDTAGLNMALQAIIGGVVSCDVQLMGMVDTMRACDGTVTLAGTPLTCNDANGWVVVDATHIRLQGTACSMLLAGAVPLEATFPCGIVLN